MAKQILNEEFRRMQLLAGVITENEYKEPTTISPEMVVNSVSKLEDKILNEDQDNYLDRLLDKILDQGIEALNDEEKQALNQFSFGKNVKSPEEIMQELFNEWKNGEIKVGNDELESIYSWEDINDFDKDLKQSFIDYTILVKQYPNIDKEDLAMVSSIGTGILAGDEYLKSTIDYKEHQDDFTNLDKKTYYNILNNYFEIDVKDIMSNLDKEDEPDLESIKSNPPVSEQIEILEKLKFKKEGNPNLEKYTEFVYDFYDGTSYTTQPYFYLYNYRDKNSVPIKTFKKFKNFLLGFKEKKAQLSN
jgi:hypothetical protein